ncbi:hypothetical protein [Streptomyces axinellae]|uniref:Uncharacterized protein n=1 Tax=Streptomyces axinellae TaxID=552788 RepID=A0ABN3R0J3_9ACTN
MTDRAILLSEEDLGNGWNEQLLLRVLAGMTPRAREIVRYIAEHGPVAPFDQVQDHFAHHAHPPLPREKFGGTMTSIKAAVRHCGPESRTPFLHRDERARTDTLSPAIAAAPAQAFAVLDAQPALAR